MTSKSRRLYVIFITTIVMIGFCTGWILRHRRHGAPPTVSHIPDPPVPGASLAGTEDPTPTLLWAHNLLLRKGPDFRIYILWVRGRMLRTNPKVHPSLDDPESFVFDIQKGVIHANIGDVATYLNAVSPSNAPLKNISLKIAGTQIQLHGTLHRIVPLPIAITGSLSSTPDGLIRFHTTKLSLLKVPMKGLLKGFHVTIADLIYSSKIPGTTIVGNDIIFNTTRLLPPPHIRGDLTSVRVVSPNIEVIYGNSRNDESKLAQWHNFLRLTGGTLDFGKLTMRNADLTMIDATKDRWFYLDLTNYQAQIVDGTTRMTPRAGLQIFMPSLSGQKTTNRTISLEWLKNRKLAIPPDR